MLEVDVESRPRLAVGIDTLPLTDVGGPTLQFVGTAGSNETEGQGFMRGTIVPGGFVPLHSHADPESFLVLEGPMEVYVDDGKASGWNKVDAGSFVTIPVSAKHAWRNQGSKPASVFIAVNQRLYSFLQTVARPIQADQVPAAPTPEWLQQFMKTAAEYSYWNGTPEENAEIGINLFPGT